MIPSVKIYPLNFSFSIKISDNGDGIYLRLKSLKKFNQSIDYVFEV